ncbi:hypothetical protein [Paenibacillus sp.]|nr:hypothetical protein [Paenibacillus sp.]
MTDKEQELSAEAAEPVETAEAALEEVVEEEPGELHIEWAGFI